MTDSRAPQRQPVVGIANFRDDSMYPRVVRAVDAILRDGKVVAPIDVLVRMSLLTLEKVEDWRHRRVPYLEKVTNCNLARLSRLLRILRFHAHDLSLVPSKTVYTSWGRGRRQILWFSKTGDPRIEEAYSRCFVWPGKGTPPRHEEVP